MSGHIGVGHLKYDHVWLELKYGVIALRSQLVNVRWAALAVHDLLERAQVQWYVERVKCRHRSRQDAQEE